MPALGKHVVLDEMLGVSLKNHHPIGAARTVIEALVEIAVTDFTLVGRLHPAMGPDGIPALDIFKPAIEAINDPDAVAVSIGPVVLGAV
jgi:hypothetical protein